MKKRRDRKERRYLQEQMSFFVFKTGRDIWGRKSQKRPGSTEIYQNNPGLGILFFYEGIHQDRKIRKRFRETFFYNRKMIFL